MFSGKLVYIWSDMFDAKEYSREEVLRHNTASDCWLIIANEVYDLTNFIKTHPGGMDILLTRAGEDATSYFLTKHSKQKHILQALSQYKIGQLPIHQYIPKEALEEPFLLELMEEITQKKLYTIDEDTMRRFFFIRTSLVIAFFVLSFIALYALKIRWLAAILVFFQAIIGTSLFGLIAHEATHRNYPYQPFLKKALYLVWPVFWPFISRKPLFYEHNSHHVKIGDPEHDFEVAGFAGLIRFSALVDYRSSHKWQHKIAAVLYPFYANIITTYGGATSRFWSSHNRRVYWQHGLSLLVTFVYFIAIPGFLSGHWWWYVLLYLLYQCTLYYGIYIGAAINHFTPLAWQDIPKEKSNYYAYYICSNTTNFRTFHPFWFWYTGGFNVQIEHHLLPFIPVENLHKLVPIVKGLCRKYQYPYKEYPTFRLMWREHYEYLQNLANPHLQSEHVSEIKNKRGYQAR